MSPFLLNEFTEKEISIFYGKYHPELEGLTNEEKENKLINFVAEGVIPSDVALVLSVKEGLID